MQDHLQPVEFEGGIQERRNHAFDMALLHASVEDQNEFIAFLERQAAARAHIEEMPGEGCTVTNRIEMDRRALERRLAEIGEEALSVPSLSPGKAASKDVVAMQSFTAAKETN